MKKERWPGDFSFCYIFVNGSVWVKWPFQNSYKRYDEVKSQLRKMELVKAEPMKYEPKKLIEFLNI